jgi:hypothetical protein
MSIMSSWAFPRWVNKGALPTTADGRLMADVEFVPDHPGLAQLLPGAEVHGLIMDRARAGAQFADSIAPRRTGEYAAGIQAEDGSLGGPRHDGL